MCSTARTSRETAATLGFALADHFPLHDDCCGGFRRFPGAPLYDGPARVSSFSSRSVDE
jgi:hypothetical protein